MHYRTEEIKFIAYFTDILNHFYEDVRDVYRLAHTLGFDLEEDYFLAVTFMFPSTEFATIEEKEELRTILSKGITTLPATNKSIEEQQYLYMENGVATFLIGKEKKELTSMLDEYKEQALEVVKNANLEKRVRIGFGLIERDLKGIDKTYKNAKNAVSAGEIFKNERNLLDYMSMEIYSSINAMITNYGDRMTTVVLKQLDEDTQNILAKYYKCKEDITKTAQALSITEDVVAQALESVKENTGLDVNDTEDNFKLHLVMIAKKVLGTNAMIEEVKQKRVDEHYKNRK